MDEAYRKVSYVVRPENEKDRYCFEDFVSTNVSATCSVMFRRDCFPGFPDWFFRHIAGDWSVNLLNLTSGPYGYLREPMSAYRIHAGGVWTSMSQFARLSSEATFYGVLIENFDTRFHPKLKAARLQRLFWASKSACEAGDRAVSKEYFRKTLARIHENRSVPLWHLVHHFLNLFCPQILEAVRKVRK